LVAAGATDIHPAVSNAGSDESGSGGGQGGLNPRQQWRLSEFKRRLAHIDASYRFWSEVFGGVPTINESLSLLKGSLQGPARRPQRKRVRLHPEVELLISQFATRQVRQSRGSDAAVEPADIEAACVKVLQLLKPIRGRPISRVLRHYVQALMQLCEWACGEAVTACRTTNGIYAPQMTSAGGRAIERFFRSIDPRITTTSLVNIVIDTRAKNELAGKRFEDFLPLYQPESLAELELPKANCGPRVKLLGIGHPIYCS
jgi:hypothetical protein